MSSHVVLNKRACDSCHRRKVKCTNTSKEATSGAPCKNCAHANLQCTYLAIPQKKGPKGSRAKVLSELRENQRQATLFAIGSLPVARTPGLLNRAFIDSCMNFYFSTLYRSQPLIHTHRAQNLISIIDQSTEAYCVIAALCAVVIIQAGMSVDLNLLPPPSLAHPRGSPPGLILLRESVRVRTGVDYLENPSDLSVLTSWLYYECYLGLGKDNTAWSYLREATTQAQLIRMHEEGAYADDQFDSSRKRILFWLLFIAERTQALHKYRPISLYPTIHLPALSGDLDHPIASRLTVLVKLYEPFGEEFFGLWNKAKNTANIDIPQLHGHLSEAVPGYLDCQNAQEIDIRVSQQWLRTQVWQLCADQQWITSVAEDRTMTVNYPFDISRDLLSTSRRFPQNEMEALGIGLINKLFDIASCLMDVIETSSRFSKNPFTAETQELVTGFLTLIAGLSKSRYRYYPLLCDKVNEIWHNFPIPQPPNVPQNGLSGSSADLTSAGLGLVPSSVHVPAGPVGPPMYTSTDLSQQHVMQTGAQSHPLPSNGTPTNSRLMPFPGSAVSSQPVTPRPYGSLSGHATSTSSHPTSNASQHSHQQGQQQLDPSAYDPRFNVYQPDPSMGFQQGDADPTRQNQGHPSAFYNQGSSNQHGGGQGRGPQGNGFPG